MLPAIGIHNAWDTVTFIFLEEAAERDPEDQSTAINDSP
jgi:hypothetical protein